MESKAIAEQRAAIDASITANLEQIKKIEDDVAKAKVEVLTISEKLTAELRADDQPDAAAVTATAVHKFFDELPPEVAQHPEGSTAIASIKSLFERLDNASKLASATREPAVPANAQAGNRPPEAAAFMDEDIDEDGLQLFAEIATPECDGEQHKEHVKFYHASREDFEKQRERDHMKGRLCEAFGVKLIRVPLRVELDSCFLSM